MYIVNPQEKDEVKQIVNLLTKDCIEQKFLTRLAFKVQPPDQWYHPLVLPCSENQSAVGPQILSFQQVPR